MYINQFMKTATRSQLAEALRQLEICQAAASSGDYSKFEVGGDTANLKAGA